MRDASSIVLIEELIAAGARIRAYDPVVLNQAGKEFSKEWIEDGRLVLVDNQYHALEGADALVLVTEWKAFRQPDFKIVSDLLKNRIIFDGRNQYDPEEMMEKGFEYHGMGREVALKKL